MNIINRLATRTSVFRNLTDTLSKVSAEALSLTQDNARLRKENEALRLNCHALAADRNRWATKCAELQQQAARQTKTKRTARKDTNKQDK